MIIKLKRFSSPNLITSANPISTTPLKAPKPKILGEKSKEITSKNGVKFRRRLDEDSNLNLGKELKKLEEEKQDLSKLKMEDI